MTNNTRVNEKLTRSLIILFPYGVVTKADYLLHMGNGSSAVHYQLQALTSAGYLKKKTISNSDGGSRSKLTYYALTPKGFDEIRRLFYWSGFCENKGRINYSGENIWEICVNNDILSILYPFGIVTRECYNFSFPQTYGEHDKHSLFRIINEGQTEWLYNITEYDRNTALLSRNIGDICDEFDWDEDAVRNNLYFELQKPYPYPISSEIRGMYLPRNLMRRMCDLSKNDLQSHAYYNHAGVVFVGSKPYLIYHCGKKSVYLSKQYITAAERMIMIAAPKMNINTSYNLVHKSVGLIFYYNSYDVVRQINREYKRIKQNPKAEHCYALFKKLYMVPVSSDAHDLLNMVICDSYKLSELKKRYEERFRNEIESYSHMTFYNGIDMDLCTLFEIYKELKDGKSDRRYAIICRAYQEKIYTAIFKDPIGLGKAYVYNDDRRITEILHEIEEEADNG